MTLVEIWNSNFIDEGKEPEPQPIERTIRVLKLSDGLRKTVAGIRLSIDTD